MRPNSKQQESIKSLILRAVRHYDGDSARQAMEAMAYGAGMNYRESLDYVRRVSGWDTCDWDELVRD